MEAAMAAKSERELNELKRTELQRLAKQHGIKANKKNADIIKSLLEHFNKSNASNEQTNLPHIEKTEQQKQVEKEDSRASSCKIGVQFDDEVSKNKENDDAEISFKKTVTTKIPKRIGAALKDDKQNSATKLKFQRIHSKSFSKMESIDDYIKKKTSRANNLKSSVKSVASDVLDALSAFKKSHNTPKTPKMGMTPKAMALQKTGITPKAGTATPKGGIATKAATTSKVSFTPKVKFASKSKMSIGAGGATLNLSNVKSKVDSWHKERTTSRRTVFDFRSPLNKMELPKKTVNKFDLKESLKKPLSYKPHRGKLFGLEKTYINKENVAEPRKTDVKTMNRTQEIKREQRRIVTKNNRNNAKQKLLDRRRGLVN